MYQYNPNTCTIHTETMPKHKQIHSRVDTARLVRIKGNTGYSYHYHKHTQWYRYKYLYNMRCSIHHLLIFILLFLSGAEKQRHSVLADLPCHTAILGLCDKENWAEIISRGVDHSSFLVHKITWLNDARAIQFSNYHNNDYNVFQQFQYPIEAMFSRK